MTDEKDIVEEAKIRLEKARKVVSNMCSGDGKWLMQIPANPNQDSDIIISNSLNDVDRLIQEVEKLKKWKSEWEDRYYRLEKSSLSEIASLKAQLSESQERVRELERLAVKKQWENIKQ